MIAQKQECRDSTEKMTTTPLQEDNTDIDIFRNLGFLFYGGLYQGMAQNYLYNVLYPSWFGTDDSSLVLIQEVLADNLIFAPLLCLPVAYAFKAAFTSQDLSLETFKKGLERYIEDVTSKGLLMQYWKIWVPGQFLTFGIIPPHFRVVFVAAISFFWICILSQISSSASETNVQAGVSLE
jgi:protein Mpv17